MTSKLKCPFCGEELAKDENLDGGAYVPYFCENDKCMKSFLFYGTKELWQALIQAKQDLEIARKALDWVGNNRLAENPVRIEQLRRHARNALEQIEHKE